jgi:hypothetical protein
MKSEMGEEMRRNYNELNLGMKRVENGKKVKLLTHDFN